MELFTNSIKTIPFHPLVTFSTDGSKILFITVFTVKGTLLFHKAHVNQGPTAADSGADEVIWAPGLA